MSKIKVSGTQFPVRLVAAVAATTKSLNATIGRLSAEGSHHGVLHTFNSMLKFPTASPDTFTYPSVLKACTSLRFFSLGLSAHQRIIVSGFASDSYIASSLISFYTGFKNTDFAVKVFDRMTHRNIVAWTAVIRCYSCAGDMKNAFFMFNSMQYEGISPSSVTILNMLSGVLESIHVEMLHSCIIKNGFSDTVLGNFLLSVYAKCGRLEDAKLMFDQLDAKDLVSWNSLINAYSTIGNLNEALKLFCRMRQECMQPDQQTFGSILCAIANENNLEVGKVVHGQIVTNGFASDKHVGTSLITLLSRCANVEQAQWIFDRAGDKDVVYWTSMISGLVQNDSADKALLIFQEMLSSRFVPSGATIACALAACAQMAYSKLGRSIHGFALRRRMMADIPTQNSLISMYAKCGLLEKSFQVFREMKHRDVVSWNAIVAGYAQNGYLERSLYLFHEMRLSQQLPDSVTVICLLQVCASIGACHQGKWIHNFILRSCLGPSIRVGTALVDMYAKCGNLDYARRCFDRMPQHDNVSWSTIISGYGSHGQGNSALAMFSRFLQTGLKPNDVVFLSTLYACSHNGLLETGIEMFESMKHDYNIEPSIEHCGCIIDLLCRAGKVTEAYEFYKKMFTEPMADVLGILLDACRISRNEDLSRIIAQEISKFEPDDAGKYVQLAHSFAATEKWHGVGEAWAQMRSLGLKKLPGWSFVEMHGVITPFFTSHNSHPQYHDIVASLNGLTSESKEVESLSEFEDIVQVL